MKTPTAEEYIKTNLTDFWEGGKAQYTGEDVAKAMIEFAKLHVEAAIKACIEDAPSGSSTDTVSQEDVVEALKDSYPLENIK
jgi:hypothetical protein